MSIFLILFHTVLSGVNLFIVVTNLHHESLLDWLITSLALALAFLKLIRFTGVVCLLKVLRAFLLFFIALAHSSFHQGLKYLEFTLPEVL